MAEPQASNIGWWKLENANAETGTNFTENGTSTWSAAKFNNGYYSNNIANYLSLGSGASGNPTANTKGILEYWFKPDFNSGTSVLMGHTENSSATRYVKTYTQNGLATAWIGTQFVQIAQTWSAGDLIHFLVAWDSTGGLTGSNTIALYWNGTNIGNNNAALTMGADSFFVGRSFGTTAQAVVDNIKIYNNSNPQSIIQSILDNRNNEGFPSTARIQKQAIII
jgi:hypothetical protein